LLDWLSRSFTPEKDLTTASELLSKAVARDPSFLLAYCRLAEAHDGIYFLTSLDHTPSRLALAKSAIDSAFHLKPDAGEAHLALALHFYWGYTDYDHARAELALARETLPNNPRLFQITALIDRRQNRWREALRNFERASELDPRNTLLLTHLAGACWFSRAYTEADNAFARVLAIDSKNSDARLSRAFNALSWRADIGAFRAAVAKIKADDSVFAETDGMKGAMFMLAISDRDFAAAGRIAETLAENDPRDETGLGRKFRQGLLARVKGDAAEARSAFTVARVEQEEAIRARPNEVKLLCGLGLIDAGLGRTEEALREGRRAVELLPVAKDSLDGPIVLTEFAKICAWTGECDLAVQQLEIAAKIPGGPDYGELRLSPMWDPLRGDPRFEKIVSSLAPKEMVSK
jgi:tetratricopeptide (TPR) repeat protein